MRDVATKPKVSLQMIGAILRKAGFRASKYHASRQVRGWGTSSQGYELRKDYFDEYSALLRYRSGSFGRHQDLGQLVEYEKALVAAGLVVERDGDCLKIKE